MTQAELASRAGISRTAVTAIEGSRLIPSVSAALSLAKALDTTVELLFCNDNAGEQSSQWAWQPQGNRPAYWQAEVNGQHWFYPADSLPMLALPPDGLTHAEGEAPAAALSSSVPTLVLAGCDPAAGLLASLFGRATGMRMLVLQRSTRQSLELLQQGKVHAAGLHLSTADDPERNSGFVREMLGGGYMLLRIAHWQEGIAAVPSTKVRSVRGAVAAKLTWIGREVGSGARLCLDRLRGDRPAPRRIAKSHRQVAEAVKSGWADVGVCLQLVSSEAGLDFLPVQEEAYDLCVPRANFGDPLLQSLLAAVRSTEYRRLLGGLPGYNTTETGELAEVR